MPKAKVTSKGQITLPKEVRAKLGLEPGEAVEFIEERGEFRLRRHVGPSPFTQYRGYLTELHGKDPDRVLDELRGEA